MRDDYGSMADGAQRLADATSTGALKRLATGSWEAAMGRRRDETRPQNFWTEKRYSRVNYLSAFAV